MKLKTILAMLALAVNIPAHADMISIGTTDDRTIGDTNGDQIGDSLAFQNDGYLRTGFYTNYWRSALEFDLSGIASGSVIDSASFYIHDQGSSVSGTLNIWGYSGDGVVTVSDGSMTGNLIGTINIISAAGAQDFYIDATSFIQDLIDSQAAFAGFLIGSNTPTGFGGGASDLCSGDNNNHCQNSHYPSLTVSYTASSVPEPASIALMGLGLAGLGLSRRKAKSTNQ